MVKNAFMETLLPILGSLVSGLPSSLVLIAAIALAMSRWAQHPRVSMYVCGGAGTMLVLELITRALWVVLPMRMSPSEMGSMFQVLSFASGVLHAVTMGVLVAAIFIDRGPQRQ